MRISYRFRYMDALCSKIAYFPTSPLLCLMPPSGGKPCDINVIYTPLESTFNGPQIRRWKYGIIFIRLAVVGSQSQIYEIS